MTRSSPRPVRVLFIGPTSALWEAIAGEVEADLARLTRDGVELVYRCTGDGPLEVRSDVDARAAAPFVARTAIDAATDGFDALIVDCTADPGVADARAAVDIPVIGAGEALRSAIARARQPLCMLTGDELRNITASALVARVSGSATVALGGTGFSHLVDVIIDACPGIVVLDPLTIALDAAIDACRAQP